MKRISKPLWLNTKGCRWLCTFAWHFPRFQTNLYHGKGLERVLSGWWVNTSSENGFNHIKQGKVRHSTCMCWSQLTKSKTDLTFLAEVGHGLRDRQFDLSWAKTCLGDKHLATHFQNHLTSIIVRNREQVTEGEGERGYRIQNCFTATGYTTICLILLLLTVLVLNKRRFKNVPLSTVHETQRHTDALRSYLNYTCSHPLCVVLLDITAPPVGYNTTVISL